jgi:DNA primase
MEVSEAVIYNEVNKLRQQKSFQDRNKYPGPEDLPAPKIATVRQVPHDVGSFYSEEEIIRLLLKYGSETYEKKINPEDLKENVKTISDYIVFEIVSDDLHFDNSTFAKIFNDYNFHVEQGLFPGDKYWVWHQDPDISQVSAQFLSDSYVLSNIWKTKQTYIETEDMLLKEIVPDTVLKFKSDKLKIEKKKMQLQMEADVKSGNNENVGVLLKRISAIDSALRRISKNLGDRIVI